MDIALTQLRALAEVARHSSFSRAAAALHVTQPAVSMQIRQLETAVGLPLLERIGKRAVPTRAGEVLIAHASRALHELETGVETVRRLRGVVSGRVRLGTSVSISIYLLPPLLRRFRARYPETELMIVTGTAPEITRAIVRNDLDLGLVSLPVRGRELTVTPFYEDELVAIAPPGREWRRRRTVGAVELGRAPFILHDTGSTVRKLIDDWFHRARVAPSHPMELGNTEAIKELVREGVGLSIASWFSVRAEVKAGVLVAIPLEPAIYRELGVVQRRDKPATAVLQAFRAALEALSASLHKGRGRLIPRRRSEGSSADRER